MSEWQLLQALSDFDIAEAESIFGAEFTADIEDSFAQYGVERAPVHRVAIVTEAFLPKVDGVSKSAYLTIRYLQQSGREALVIAPDISIRSVGETRVIPMRSFGLRLAPETRIALPSRKIGTYLDEFQPDILHLFSPAWLSLGAVLAARKRGIPIVANYQTDLPGYAIEYGLPRFTSHLARALLRLMHNRCHINLAPSPYTLGQLRSWGFKRLRIWKRGVSITRFHPQRASSRWRERLLNGRDPDSLLCLYVGRLAQEKRVRLLREVARTKGVALTIIGDGVDRPNLEAALAGTDVHFTGYLFGDELSQAFASADVFLFPGMAETFGQVVQEAMASGLPCVVANRGGAADLIEEGVNGYSCAPEEAEFARIVRQLRDDRAHCERLGQQARKFAEMQPWEKILTELEGHYDRAIRLNQRALRLSRRR